MKILPLLLASGLVALAGCNKPAETPAAPAPEAAPAATPEAAPATTTPAEAPAAAPTAAPAPVDPALVTRLARERVPYVCDNEETVELRVFPDQGVAALWRGGKSTELQQVKAYPPTFRYEAGPITSVEGTPAEFTMQVGAMALTQCKVKQ